MSLKSKKLRKIARNAAMSALIVSAIVGTGVVASAAPAATHDNLSITESAAFGRVTVDGKAGIVSGIVDNSVANNSAIGGLKVSGGALYVGQNLVVHGKLMGAEKTNTNAWVTGGTVFVGQKAPGTGVVQPTPGSVTLTVDNMTIDGGTVSVTSSSTLDSKGDIDINGGTLQLSGNIGNVDGANSGSTVKATNVNINKGGTLAATQGNRNVVNASADVNLKGGTIFVAKGAGLTIGSTYDVAAGTGNMVVAHDGRFVSSGGTINAGVIVKSRAANPSTPAATDGKTTFKAGTTTMDNLTVSDGGLATIEGGATVASKQDVTIEGNGSMLEMKGGTLRVLDPKGAVNVTERGTLKASAGVNTVDANVKVTKSGLVSVVNSASLTITKDLTVDGGNVAVGADPNAKGKANLILNGGLTAGVGSIIVGGAATTDASKGTLTLGYGALTAKTVADRAIVMGNGATTNNKNGTLIVKNYGKSTMEVAGGTTTDKDLVTSKTSGGILGKSYADNNVVIWGTNLTENGKIIAAKSDGTQSVTAGVNVEITSSTLSAEIIAPSITAKDSVLDVAANGSVTLLGLGMGDKANLTTSLNTLKLSANNSIVSVNDGATLKAGTLEMVAGSKLDVLNAIANVGTLKASGGIIFVDPSLLTIGAIEGKFGAQVLVGAGSVTTVGGAQGWMAKPMADAGFAFGNTNQATLGLAPKGTITLDATGGIAVDPTSMKDDTFSTGYKYKDAITGDYKDATLGNLGKFYAGAGSLTVLDVSALGNKPVFDLNMAGAGKVNIVDGAKLHIANLTVKGVQVFANSATSGTVVIEDGKGVAYDPDRAGTPSTGWTGSNLIQPDRMLSAKMTKTGLLGAKVNSAGAALGMSSEFEGMMQGVWGLALNNTNAANAGIRLVSRAASTDFGLSASQAGKTIEGAAQLGAVAGVQGVTIGAANAATSAVATRTSFAQPLLDKTKAVAMNMDSEGHVSIDSGLSAGNGMKNGLALWIMPLYQSNNVWGQKAGNFKSGYNSDLGGVAAGVDYTVNDMFRFGAALNIGAGYGQSSGDFASTDNSFNFWGVNLYGGWTMNNFGLTADVGYTGNYNKVEQDAPASLGMGNFKSDINSSAWTAGLKGEYKIETEMMDIIPHIGVRYMGLTTEQYDVKGGGGTMFDVEQGFQSIWTFPIGVALSKNIETGSGWVFKPQLDLSVIPAAGDVEAKSKSRIPGAPGSAEAKMQVVDYVTFDGGVGFDIGNENLSFGLNYNIQASEHRTGHGVFGTVRYEF